MLFCTLSSINSLLNYVFNFCNNLIIHLEIYNYKNRHLSFPDICFVFEDFVLYLALLHKICVVDVCFTRVFPAKDETFMHRSKFGHATKLRPARFFFDIVSISSHIL